MTALPTGRLAVSGYQPLDDGISVYVHIPFCRTKCPYCDFNTYQGLEDRIETYVDALVRDTELWGRALGHPMANTVFFGGGTPSYIPTEDLGRLLKTIGSSFPMVADVEVTAEANPGDVEERALEAWLGMGVNRLSIGVQSLDDRLLSLLGRRHTAADAVRAHGVARGAGFDNVNLDLMYGLPRQTLDQWRDTFERTLELRPSHLSLYSLTLEGGTPMERWVREGVLTEPDPDLAADMYELARGLLGAEGYLHYEISNWALPGRESRHNMAYWLNRPYLGLGAGAHSHLAGRRFWTVRSPRDYVRRVGEWASHSAMAMDQFDPDALTIMGAVDGDESIDRRTEMAETMFLGMRLLEGISMEAFRERFGVGPMEVYGEQVRELEEGGLLEFADGRLCLTERGLLLANQVFVRFV